MFKDSLENYPIILMQLLNTWMVIYQSSSVSFEPWQLFIGCQYLNWVFLCLSLLEILGICFFTEKVSDNAFCLNHYWCIAQSVSWMMFNVILKIDQENPVQLRCEFIITYIQIYTLYNACNKEGFFLI